MPSRPLNRRQTLGLLATPALPRHTAHAHSTWRPSQPITFGIGMAAGGSVDQYAWGVQRALEQLQLLHGQAVVASNQPGAVGLLVLLQQQASAAQAPWRACPPGANKGWRWTT